MEQIIYTEEDHLLWVVENNKGVSNLRVPRFLKNLGIPLIFPFFIPHIGESSSPNKLEIFPYLERSPGIPLLVFLVFTFIDCCRPFKWTVQNKKYALNASHQDRSIKPLKSDFEQEKMTCHIWDLNWPCTRFESCMSSRGRFRGTESDDLSQGNPFGNRFPDKSRKLPCSPGISRETPWE